MMSSEQQQRGLQVIGAGFGRTGTFSTKEALNILGFPCYHMTEVISNGDQKLWLDAKEKKEYKWDEIFKNYSATDYFKVWVNFFLK